jgi:hypothetical protein
MPDEVTDQVPPQPDPQPVPEPEPAPPPPDPTPESPPVPPDADAEVEQDPASEIWEGGPTYAMLHAWKEQYGPDSIYVTSITEKQHVVWRTLTRFEYRRLVKNMEQAVATGTLSQAEANMNNEEQIVEICALWPKYSRQQLAGQLAGLPSIISQEVMEASAFMSLDVKQL